MNIKELKKQLRKEISLQKKNLSPESFLSLSSIITQKIEELPLFRQASCIALYYSLPDEVQTIAWIEKWYTQKTILLPVIEGNDIFFIPYRGKDNLKESYWGLNEPTACENKESLPPIDLIIVPGIAFDKELNRMGRGKGYYDRFLSETKAHKIGVCFDEQLLDEIPTEPFDVKMDTVITPTLIIG